MILSVTEWMNRLAALRTVINRYGWVNVLEAVKYLENES